LHPQNVREKDIASTTSTYTLKMAPYPESFKCHFAFTESKLQLSRPITNLTLTTPSP
jgi:hypothetical protein